VIGPMTQHAALMSVLVNMLDSGTPLQLQRVVSTMNHLSRSSVSAKQLRARRVPQANPQPSTLQPKPWT